MKRLDLSALSASIVPPYHNVSGRLPDVSGVESRPPKALHVSWPEKRSAYARTREITYFEYKRQHGMELVSSVGTLLNSLASITFVLYIHSLQLHSLIDFLLLDTPNIID